MYWYIIDIVIVLVIFLTVILSIKRGFIQSLVRLAGVVIALVAAFWTSKVLAAPIFNAWIRDRLVEGIVKRLEDGTASSVYEALESGLLGILLGIFGLNRKLAEYPVAVSYTRAVAESVVNDVVRPPMESLLAVILFLLVFSIVMLLVHLIAHLTGAVNAIPIVGALNQVLGGVLGLAYGFGLAILIVVVLISVFTMIGRIDDFAPMIRENTVLLSWLFNLLRPLP